jgi:hypothetical protein
MLAVAMLFATLSGPATPALVAQLRQACPATPLDAIVTAERRCAAIEVSGHADASGVTIDPAFTVVAATSLFARPVPGQAKLAGFTADGRELFEFPFQPNGSFTLVLPLLPQLAAAMTSLALTINGVTYVRTATPHDAPSAEAIATDESHVVFAWDAQEFPAVRIVGARSGEAIATFAGDETYQQVVIRTSERRFTVSFSDGIHSIDRTVTVFGR